MNTTTIKEQIKITKQILYNTINHNNKVTVTKINKTSKTIKIK